MLPAITEYLVAERSDLGLTQLAPTAPLIDDGILDSMFLLQLVAFLEERFAVTIEPDEISVENFETPAHIARLVATKLPAA